MSHEDELANPPHSHNVSVATPTPHLWELKSISTTALRCFVKRNATRNRSGNRPLMSTRNARWSELKCVETFFVKPTNTKVIAVGSSSLLHMCCAKKRKTRPRFWIHPVIANRDDQGKYQHLIQELRSGPALFRRYFRLSVEQFDDLLGLVERFHWSTQVLLLR